MQLRDLQEQVLGLTRLMLMGEMIGGIAHDLNNNLGVIRIYADQLSELKANFSEEDKAFLDQAVSSIDLSIIKSEQMVSHMRSFLRGTLDQPTEFHIDKTFDEVFAVFERQFTNRGISFLKNIESPLPPLRGKKFLIEHTLMHLLIVSRDVLSNASKKEIRFLVNAGHSDNQIDIVLEMTGIGDVGHFSRLLNDNPSETMAWKNHDWCMNMTGRMIRQWGGQVEVRALAPSGNRIEVKLPTSQSIPMKEAA